MGTRSSRVTLVTGSLPRLSPSSGDAFADATHRITEHEAGWGCTLLSLSSSSRFCTLALSVDPNSTFETQLCPYDDLPVCLVNCHPVPSPTLSLQPLLSRHHPLAPCSPTGPWTSGHSRFPSVKPRTPLPAPRLHPVGQPVWLSSPLPVFPVGPQLCRADPKAPGPQPSQPSPLLPA